MTTYEFTNEEVVDYIMRAVHDRTGDDLERARSAFRGLSPDQMQENYGQSGKTRQSILNEYERERALATAAVRYATEAIGARTK